MFWRIWSKVNLHLHSSERAASHSAGIRATRFDLTLGIGSGVNFALFVRKEGGLDFFFSLAPKLESIQEGAAACLTYSKGS